MFSTLSQMNPTTLATKQIYILQKLWLKTSSKSCCWVKGRTNIRFIPGLPIPASTPIYSHFAPSCFSPFPICHFPLCPFPMKKGFCRHTSSTLSSTYPYPVCPSILFVPTETTWGGLPSLLASRV